MSPLVDNVAAAFAECNQLRKENTELKTALRRISSLEMKNVPKYAQEIAREALAATS